MANWIWSNEPRWYIGHTLWLYLECTGDLERVLRFDSRKPYVRVKARRS